MRAALSVLLIVLLPSLVAASAPPPGCGQSGGPSWLIAYTQQPRLTTTILDVEGHDPVQDMANWQRWYDGGRPNRHTESDVVLDSLAGQKRVVFDCTSEERICAAADQRFSPDGSRLIFTVAYGDALSRAKSAVTNTPFTLEPVEFQATRYELWVHDVEADANVLLGEGRMPAWASNDQIVFASCRAGVWPEWAYHGNDFRGDCSTHIYRADIANGSLDNLMNLTPAATMAMSPMVATDGRVFYTDWWGFGEKGRGGTPANMHTINSVRLNGTDRRVEINAHEAPDLKTRDYLTGTVDLAPGRSGEGSTKWRLTRPPVELSKGKLAFVNYYRSNHLGPLGIIFECGMNGAPEGMLYSSGISDSIFKNDVAGLGQFVPADCTALTPYGTDTDNVHRFHWNGRLMGKAGHPQPTTWGKMLFTHCRGMCYEATLPSQTFPDYTGGEPSAKREIRLALVDRVTDPFDTKQSITIACSEPELNCWDAVQRTAYQSLYGQPVPSAAPEDLPPNYVTVLRVVDIRQGEIHLSWQGEGARVRLQGNALPDWQSRIAGLRITRIIPWPRPADRGGFYGEQHIADLYADTNGRLEGVMPCGIVYQMSGIDKDGVEVAWDTSKHYARCGEVVTCHGCHDGHSVERQDILGMTPEERWHEGTEKQ